MTPCLESVLDVDESDPEDEFDKHCVEVELVRQVHTLVVRSAQVKVVFELQVREEVEGVRQEVREVESESKVEESRSLHERMWMR